MTKLNCKNHDCDIVFLMVFLFVDVLQHENERNYDTALLDADKVKLLGLP